MDLTISNPTLSLSNRLRNDVAAADASRLADQELFASVLSRARQDQGATDEATKARTAAEDFVAQALVEPVLKQMREMSQAAAPFAPNQAEKAFRTMLDGAMAQRVVKSGNWTLVDKVAERIAGNAGVVPTAERAPMVMPAALETIR